MLGKFLPRQGNFFLLFRQAGDKLVQAAEQFRQLVHDLPNAHKRAELIHSIERQGDEIALLSYGLLNRTFITPFDRDDIHALTSRLDDILDHLNRLAQRIVIYEIHSVPPGILKLADLCLSVIDRVRAVVDRLDSLKNQAAIFQICVDIDQLENDGEAVLLQGIKELFANETNLKQLLKIKEIYEQIKNIINTAQDLSNLVKSIVLEYA